MMGLEFEKDQVLYLHRHYHDEPQGHGVRGTSPFPSVVQSIELDNVEPQISG